MLQEKKGVEMQILDVFTNIQHTLITENTFQVKLQVNKVELLEHVSGI